MSGNRIGTLDTARIVHSIDIQHTDVFRGYAPTMARARVAFISCRFSCSFIPFKLGITDLLFKYVTILRIQHLSVHGKSVLYRRQVSLIVQEPIVACWSSQNALSLKFPHDTGTNTIFHDTLN